MRAVPQGLRDGSLALGATRLETAFRVVLPAAISGVAAAFVLGISRAVGETMVVAIAAGQQPNLTFDPREPAATITAYIVQVALGDLPHGSIGYQSIFAAGLMLLLITLIFNMVAFWLRARSGRLTDGRQRPPMRAANRGSSAERTRAVRRRRRRELIFVVLGIAAVALALLTLASACSISRGRAFRAFAGISS